MGNIVNGIDYKLHPDVVPAFNQPSKFDPLLGFPNGRKEKGDFGNFLKLICFLKLPLKSLNIIVLK